MVVRRGGGGGGAGAGLLFLPALVVIPVSFTDRSYLSFPAESWSWQHYRQLVDSPVWRGSLLQSVAVSAVSTLAATLLGAAAAIGAWRLGARLGRWCACWRCCR